MAAAENRQEAENRMEQACHRYSLPPSIESSFDGRNGSSCPHDYFGPAGPTPQADRTGPRLPVLPILVVNRVVPLWELTHTADNGPSKHDAPTTAQRLLPCRDAA
jgi:hypothetical protein